MFISEAPVTLDFTSHSFVRPASLELNTLLELKDTNCNSQTGCL